MPRLFFIFLLVSGALLQAQQQFIVRIYEQDDGSLPDLLRKARGVRIIRNLNFPRLQINGLAVAVDAGSEDEIRAILTAQFAGNFLFVPDPTIAPTEGSGDDLGAPFLPDPPGENPVLDSLVPNRPVLDPLVEHLPGNVLIDIIGTGIDYTHPDLDGLNFEPALSVMFGPGGDILPGDIDYHNHETRLAGCMGGTNTGLLSALGTASDARFRSVLCYPKPVTLGSAIPTTYTSDCLAALAEVISAHEARLATPYLHNHAAVLCFSHSVEALNTRVGDLDSLFDLAWERGIVTSISAGNHAGTAAASSPAGAGEWVAFDTGGGVGTLQYWPPPGAASYSLPGAFGFEISGGGSQYHLKTGAHNGHLVPAPWSVNGTLGSGLNTPNPVGFGPPMNAGVDLFAPGENIQVPATRLTATVGSGPVVIDGSTYFLEQGYQTGNGTSYSAAFTAALAARILQLRPWATPDQVRSVILASTTSSGSLDLLTTPNFPDLPPMSLTYPGWIARYLDIAPPGFFNDGRDDLNADPDFDGVPNFIEYYCGMDPRFPDSQHAPKVTFNHTTRILSVKMQRACYLPESPGIDWNFQAGNDLLDWIDLGQGTPVASPHTDANGDGVGITSEFNILSAEPKKFYRFSISANP